MATNESKTAEFAEDLGKLLSTAQVKAQGWLGQRTQIAKTLEGVRDTASRLLADLGRESQRAVRGRRGRPPGSGTSKRGPGRPKGSGRKRRKMSAAARAKISAAQKARWARQKAGETKKAGRPKGSGRKRRKMSAAARAKISAAQKARWARHKAGETKKVS